MNGTWQSFSKQQRAVAQRLFDARLTCDLLLETSGQSQVEEQPVAFTDLYAYATDPEHAVSDDLLRTLQQDPRRMTEVCRLISKLAHYHAPRLAAASTSVVAHREGSGFTIDLRPSHAEPSQTYVVIAIDPRASAIPKTLFVSRQEERLIKHLLPIAKGNTIQLLLESGSDLIEALRDPECEVFLR